MQLVHDRKLAMQMDSTETAGAKTLTRWIKVAVCVALVAAFAWVEMSAEVRLIQSDVSTELAP